MEISDEMLDELTGDAKTEQDVFGKGELIKALSKRRIDRIANEATLVF